MQKKYGWILLIAAFMLVFWLGSQTTNSDVTVALPEPKNSQPITETASRTDPLPSSTVVTKSNPLPGFLPPEARTTLALIASKGPFPNRQDGVVFHNREQRLPQKQRGYYHEYTVETPGLSHRGARRIITGGNPIESYYYTDDHYDSFWEFEVLQ